MIKLCYIVTVPMTLDLLLRGQLAFMRRMGFEVSVICSPGEKAVAAAEREGVRFYAIEMTRSLNPFGDARALVSLVAALRGIGPHIVNASTGKGGPLGIIAAGAAGVPIKIYNLRGYMPDRAGATLRPVFKMVEGAACAMSDAVFAVSMSLADRYEGRPRVLASGSSNGVDTVRFDPERIFAEKLNNLRAGLGIPVDAAVVGFVGRLVMGKGIGELIAAWPVIREEIPKARLLIIGPEEEHDRLPEVIRQELASPGVLRMDYVENEDMPYYYSMMDVLAFPSHSEGMPNAPLEAAAMEVPCVAVRACGSVDAVVDGITGALVEKGNPVALAAAVNRYLMDETLRRSHGAAARARVLHEFRPEVVWNALYAEYVRLLMLKGLKPPRPVGS
jgi:glycosyltransferase involved in cell wall biosynthesis